jgi:hypothetical protein
MSLIDSTTGQTTPTLSIQALQDEWAAHPLGEKRARGGRVALAGFLYQLYISLDRFFAAVLEGNTDAKFAFEGLSDLAELRGDLIYLTQVKTTLDSRSLRSAVQEALSVGQFLVERHAELRDLIRFQIAARCVHWTAIPDIRTLTADELGLDDDQSLIWAAIRDRFLPVQICGSPRIDLAIRLWPHTSQCLEVVERCIGRLFGMLGEDRASDDITAALLEVLARARSEKPPGYLLGPRDLATAQSSSRHIVHGVRPRPHDLREGCFMERPELLEAGLTIIRETSLRLDTSPGQRRIPVFWIVGPSGVGKSVLLLQLMRELVLQGEAEVANYLGEFAHTVPRALEYWSGISERAVIIVDDLYAPENRDPEIWRQIAETAFTTTWPRSPWILTCGPTEQFKAFSREAYRHSELQLFEICISAMKLEQQGAYHDWYEQRTGSRVPVTKEPILIAAAWTYELYRQEGLSPEAFAIRFDTRLKDLGLGDSALSAISLNQYGLDAPAALFNGREAEVDQLTSEQIYRLAHPGKVVRQGRFFHPQIAKILYDAIVPQTEVRRRAEDLARAFSAMLDNGEAADTFLEWLSVPASLSASLKKELLFAMWNAFRERGPVEHIAPRLKRWHDMARSALLNFNELGVAPCVWGWLETTPEDAQHWGLLFQVMWDEADEAQRCLLYLRAEEWLPRYFDRGSWNYVWQRLWMYRSMSRELVDLGFLWLYDNPTHPGWGRVWQCMFDSGVREPDLLRTALDALPRQPDSPADLPIWEKIEALHPEEGDFLGAIIRKLACILSPHKMDLGVEFILSRIDVYSFSFSKLEPSIRDSIADPGWGVLWQALVKKPSRAPFILELGRDWLVGPRRNPSGTLFGSGWLNRVSRRKLFCRSVATGS